MIKTRCPHVSWYGDIDLGQHWFKLRLCATLVIYGFPDSMTTSQAHSPANCTQAYWEYRARRMAHSPAVFWTANLRFCSKLHPSWNSWTALMHPNKMCYVFFFPVANRICEKPTSLRIYIAGIDAKLPNCIKEHIYWCHRNFSTCLSQINIMLAFHFQFLFG